MELELDIYKRQLVDILNNSVSQISNVLPSEWTEQNLVMPKPFPGPFKYSRTPYTREIVDHLSQESPARVVIVKKGAQIGFSSGVIYPGVGWMIKNNPGNTVITVGSPDLIEKSMEKLDLMIDNAGLRELIRPQALRNRRNKSGDTNLKKEFIGGYVTIGNAGNHKTWRQVDLQYGFFDDFESVKTASKESGDTRKLIEQRFAAFADTYKIFFISTPENKHNSNIEEAYVLGDQRKWMVGCECCGGAIDLQWTVINGDITGGVKWELDDKGHIKKGSVGYICQLCGGFFTDKNKHELLNSGIWMPTATPSREGYYSYHINSLYAPLGMYDWEHYIYNYIEANPVGQPRKEHQYKTFVNLCLGEPYQSEAEEPKANTIQKNCRRYDIYTVPDKMSMNDGNGPIVLLTCAADMNGLMDDARLDWEIVAHAANEATYSVAHGSIGTFVPRENSLKNKADRERYTYEEYGRTVWKELDAIISKVYKTDTGREVQVAITGIDCGHYTTAAYAYIDRTNNHVVGLKGDKEDKYIPFGIDVANFKPAKERGNLYIIQVGKLKNDLSDYMQLKWNENEDSQPAHFMNYPIPGNGLYSYSGFFEHYESEHRIPIKNDEGNGVSYRWVKKTSVSQNHFWDVRIYNMVLKEIVVYGIGRELKQPDRKFTWKDYVDIISSNLKK
jgi:phage terminase large subunit GpA-like protein